VGEGRWISSAESLAEVQVLRGRVDAIVTGVGTVIEDNPRFTVRPPGDVSRAPLRVVLDSYLKTHPRSKLFEPVPEGHGGGQVHLLCLPGLEANRSEGLLKAGAQWHALSSNGTKQIALREVQEWLWDQGVRRVLLEAGPTLLTRYFELGFIDQMRVYSGVVNGGRGPGMGSFMASSRLYERWDRECGDDSVLEAFLEPQ
jgi:diaminohydroxyphosphoribosylaminopyrimidine deaminase/5-amino-6-(5-phosphoribosylamino)uracil reductase